ncbi:MAG: RNA-directed DNA polymerase [Dolichospermum sp.]
MLKFNLEDYLTDEKLIESSIYYTIYSRLNEDHVCNFFELNINCNNKTNINQLVTYIKNIYSLSQPYIQDKSFAYYYPKNQFFLRRCVYLPFKELAVRYHLVNTLALAVENSFIKTSFANRTQRSKSGFIYLFREYYPQHKQFIEWAEDLIIKYNKEEKDSYVLKADITSFYDAIFHDYLVNSIFNLVGNILPQKYEPLLRQILRPEVEFYSVVDSSLKSEKKQQGLLIGNSTEGYLANILLSQLDELMISHNFNYARYVDDIKIVTNTKQEAIRAVNILQEELHRIGLNLNSTKTEIIQNPKSVEDLLRKDHQISLSDKLTQEFQNKDLDKSTVEDDQDEDKIEDYLKEILKIKSFNNLEQQQAQAITKFLRKLDSKKLNQLKLGYDINDEFIGLLIENIPEIIQLLPTTIDSNTWKIVSFINFGFSNKIIIAGYKAMNEIFKNKNIMDYARTRLIHHLVKPRKKDPPYILMMVKNNDKLSEKLIIIFQDFLSSKSIDLNLNALYAIWIISHKDNGKYFDEKFFRKNIDNYLSRPISHNVSRVLSSILEQKNTFNFCDYFDFTELSNN